MKASTTREDYENYMNLVEDYLETIASDIPIFLMVRKMSYDEWVKRMNDGKMMKP